MIQLFLAMFGLTAISFAMSNQTNLRKLAPVIGLAGQPFWFAATIPNEQWGMVALCCAYTAVYTRGIWMQWRKTA